LEVLKHFISRKFLNFLHHSHKPVQFGFDVIEIKTGVGGGFRAGKSQRDFIIQPGVDAPPSLRFGAAGSGCAGQP
jgi:hypothetical protein